MLFKLPLNIRSLFLGEPAQVIGQDIVFENIPWFNKEKKAFINALAPFVTQSVIPRPFSNDNMIVLDKGLHLHWNLPSLLKTFDENGQLPEVPNRWLIVKEQRNKKEEWIIESDYIWDINDPALPGTGICTYPNPNVKEPASSNLKEGFTFDYVGRKYPGTKEKQDQGNYLDHLTALGWGSLSFDMHYGNCRSIFGFHDLNFDETADARYSITGFYSRNKKDHNYFKKLMEINRKKLKERIKGLDLDQMHRDDLFRKGQISGQATASQEFPNTFDPLEILREIDKALIFDTDHAFRYLMDTGFFHAEKYAVHLSESGTRTGEWEIKGLDARYRQEEDIETICCGTWEYKPGENSLREEKSGSLNVSIANTLPEALTAVLLKDYGTVEKLVQEERLEAILNWGELNDKNLDWVSRLRHLRHENQFRSMRATGRWEIVAANPHKNQSEMPAVPQSVEKKLKLLNIDQDQLDSEKNILYHDLECIYIDWHTYLMSLLVYKKEDVSSAGIRLIIEKKLLPFITKTESKIKILERSVENLKKSISGSLQKEFVLELKDNLHYHEPIAPSVIVYENNNNGRSSGSSVDYLRNSYKEVQKEVYVEHGLFNCEYRSVKNPFEKQSTLNSWNTYKIDWEAFFLSNKNTEASPDFLPDFLTSSYMLDDQNADLVKNDRLQNLTYSRNPNLYYGSSFVNDTVKGFIENKLNAFLKSQDIAKVQITGNTNETVNSRKSASGNKEYIEKIKADLNGISLLEITLSDFNYIFTQRTSALNIMPLIPNGFSDHKELASAISRLIKKYEGKLNLLTPNSGAQFNPFRNGAFKIDRLRLIDTFGRDKIIRIDKVSTGYHQQIQDKKNWISLPPRWAQPAAISGKWEKLPKTDSPVLGWLVINKISNRLEFFNYRGSYLGAFNNKGKWEFSPFEYHVASSVFDEDFDFLDENIYLRKTLSWLYSKLNNSPKAIEDIIRQVILTLDHIEPETTRNASLAESISAMPLALIMIHVEILIKGRVFHDLSKESQKKFADSGGQRNDLKHSEVRIPISVGDHNQYNDGCVAYWYCDTTEDREDAVLSDNLYFNYSEKAVIRNFKKIDELIAGTDRIYRVNAASVMLDEFLEKLASDHNEPFISKNEFLKYYITEGNIVWKKLLENGVLMPYESSFRLRSNDLKKSEVTLSEGLKLKYEDHNSFLSVSHGLRSKSYLMLMHPQGDLFIKSGILPVRKFEIPYKEIKESLKRIALTLYTGPVVTPVNHFEITLLKDSRYQWSWIELKKKKAKEPVSAKNPFSKLRLTQAKSIDLKKCNIKFFFESTDHLKSFLIQRKIITDLKPSLKNNPETYLLPEAVHRQHPFDKMIYEYVELKSYEKRWQKFHVNFGAEYPICRIKGSKISGFKKELIEQGFIYNTPIFEDARYVVVTGKYFMAQQDPENNLLLNNLAPVNPEERKEVKIQNVKLVNVEDELLTYLNLSLCADEYLQSELLETDDFFTGEYIYFLNEKKYSEFETVYNHLHYLNDAFSVENLEKTGRLPNADEVCRGQLLKIEAFSKAFEAGSVKDITIGDLQSVRKEMTAEGKETTEILLDFFERVENLVFNADQNLIRSESVRTKLHEIMGSKDSNFMQKFHIHYNTFEFIVENKHAISFINDFSTYTTEVPEVEMREGWLSVKSTNN